VSVAAAVTCQRVGHSYGSRRALDRVDFEVPPAQLFALLGPNGGGKSTLFRILATLMTPSEGTARVMGHDVTAEPHRVRMAIGVAFQSPGLDGKLSVRENLTHQGHLYGLRGTGLRARIDELLELFRLGDRGGDRTETLSGGLARRVDLAKAFLHEPRVLLLDEPSTGLDPAARRDLMGTLERLRAEEKTTVLLTTHLTEEADACDRVAILERGRLVACGRPDELVREVGGDVVTLAAENAERLATDVAGRFGGSVSWERGVVRLEHEGGAELLPDVLRAFGDRVRSATVARPTLEDVFFHRTGHAWSAEGTE
jgi:ABC-2 type transport system ATP-binding protein